MRVSHLEYQKKCWWLIGISMFIKMLLALVLELGNDEVYYYTYAVQPDWSHFDHPPMVGWMIQLFTFNLNAVSAFSMRLGSIVCAALSTAIIFEAGTLIKNEKAGWIAALLYTVSIYTSIIAGLFVMPDSPQLLFYTISIYLMLSWVIKPNLFRKLDWVLLGLFIGLATLSKIHGLYLWVGFGLFVVMHQLKTFRKPIIYVAGFITILCLIPILYWNFQNDFITYQFHSKRVMHTGISFSNFITEITGEILYQNPFVFLAVIISLCRIHKTKFQAKNPQAIHLLLWLSIPLIFLFWGISLFNATLPHWTGPAYISLFLIAGVYWSSYSRQMIPLLLKWAIGFVFVLVIGFVFLVYVFPKQWGSTKMENLGEYNPINDVTGWVAFSKAFDLMVQTDQQKGLMSKQAPIVVHKWFPAGHLLFYTARPLGKQVIAIGALEDVHKFAWLNKQQPNLKIGEDAYFVNPSNLPANPKLLFQNYFESIQLNPDTIPIQTNGVLLRNFYVYRLKNCTQVPKQIIP